jgi:hypothetical protein
VIQSSSLQGAHFVRLQLHISFTDETSHTQEGEFHHIPAAMSRESQNFPCQTACNLTRPTPSHILCEIRDDVIIITLFHSRSGFAFIFPIWHFLCISTQ